MLTDLQNRGVEDILIACINGLTGFPEAIETTYPRTEVQLCIIHQIRNSIKYVGSKHHKAFMAVHRQFRKLTKSKGAFPNENRLLKLLYAGILNAQEKWTMPVANWNLALSQFAIHFKGRLDEYLQV